MLKIKRKRNEDSQGHVIRTETYAELPAISLNNIFTNNQSFLKY